MVTPLQTLDNWLHGRSANDCGPPRRMTSRGDVVYEYDKSRTGLNPQRVIFRQSQDPRGGQHHVYARYTGPIGTPDHLAFNRMCDRRKNGLPYTFSTSSGRSSESGSLSGGGSGGGRDLGRAGGSEHSSRVSSGSKRQESVRSSTRGFLKNPTRSSHSSSSKGSTLGSQTSLAELSKPTIPAHTKPPIISMQTVGATTEGAYRFPPFPAFPPMPEFPAFPALPRHP